MYGFNSMAWHMILNILIDQDSGAFVDSIGQEENKPFVLFKYCLSQEEQVGLLEDTRKRHEKRLAVIGPSAVLYSAREGIIALRYSLRLAGAVVK